MASIDSLRALVVEQLRDIYDAEKRLTKALPKMIKKTTNEELGAAIEQHLDETNEHVARLERIFEAMEEKARAKPCAGMKGLIEEGDEHASEDYEEDDLRDAVIIGSAQRVEHYEIAAYGTLIAHARLLGEDDVVELLEETLAEEKAADRKLTEIAESVVNLEAAEDEEEEETTPARGRATTRAASLRAPMAMASDRSAKPRGKRR